MNQFQPGVFVATRGDAPAVIMADSGVNSYPQEVENELTMHPAVSHVAVIGVPNADLGRPNE